MKTNSRLLLLITFIYIYVPILFFLIGYTKVWVWIITAGVCIFYLIKMYKDYVRDLGALYGVSENEVNSNATVADNAEVPVACVNKPKTLTPATIIDIRLAVIIAAIIVIYCIYIGYGGIFVQAGDWSKHNAILHDLAEKSWPVYYTSHEDSMLTYYLGQYIIPALLGKFAIFVSGDRTVGFTVSSISMAVWGVIGIYLVFLNLVRVSRSDTALKQLRCLFIMLFFSGALPIAQMLVSGIYGDDMYSMGNNHWMLFNGLMMQYRSNLVMLRWVFPQVIVIWMIAIMFLEHKDRLQYYVLLISPVLMYGTFSIVMFAAFALVWFIYMLYSSKDRKCCVDSALALSNSLSFITLGSVIIAYFTGYMLVKKPSFLEFKMQEITTGNIWGVLIFDLFMFGIMGICVYKDHSLDPLYYVCMILLTIFPLFTMGLFNDFVMSASIPGLFMLMIWVIQYLNKNEDSKSYGIRVGVLAACLLVGVWYQAMEIKENVKYFSEYGANGVQDYYRTLETYSDRNSGEQEDLIYNYFTYDLDGKAFYEVFARKKIED